VVDLGSGFTSFVLRTWAASSGAEAWSVDDSAEWLERTRAYLGEKGVSSERLLTWEQASGAGGPRGFDLVLHDMGTMETRARTLEAALDLAAPGGVVILDDVHKPEYRAVAKAALEARQLPWYSLKPWTRDGICRYAWMVIR
jgi:predicted O-methyltransferase YrrM